MNTYDPAIKISEIMIDGSPSDAVTHLRWRLDHSAPGTSIPTGTIINGHNTWKNTAAVQLLPGEYRFTPLVNGGTAPTSDRQKKVVFQIEGCMMEGA